MTEPRGQMIDRDKIQMELKVFKGNTGSELTRLAEQYMEGKIGELASEDRLIELLKDISWEDFIPVEGTKWEWVVVTLDRNARKKIAKALVGKVGKAVKGDK